MIIHYLVESLMNERNPHTASDMGIIDVIHKYENRRDLYIHMSNSFKDSKGQNVSKIGINPTGGYDNPRGVYVYPIAHFIKENGSVNFRSNADSLYVIKSNPTSQKKIGKINRMTKYDSDMCYKLLEQFMSKYYTPEGRLPHQTYFRNIYNDVYKEATNKTNGGVLWYLIIYITTNISDLQYNLKVVHADTTQTMMWNSVLNYDYVGDEDGSGIIHPNEPYQGVFLTPKSYSVVESVQLKSTQMLRPVDNSIIYSLIQQGDTNINKYRNVLNNGNIIVDANMLGKVISALKMPTPVIKLFADNLISNGQDATKIGIDTLERLSRKPDIDVNTFALIDNLTNPDNIKRSGGLLEIAMNGGVDIYKYIIKKYGQFDKDSITNNAIYSGVFNGGMNGVKTIQNITGDDSFLYNSSDALIGAISGQHNDVIGMILPNIDKVQLGNKGDTVLYNIAQSGNIHEEYVLQLLEYLSKHNINVRHYPQLMNIVVGNYYDNPKVIEKFLELWGDNMSVYKSGQVLLGYEERDILPKLINSKSKYLLPKIMKNKIGMFDMRLILQTMDIPYIKYIYDGLDDASKETFLKVARSKFRDYDEEKSNIVMNALKK